LTELVVLVVLGLVGGVLSGLLGLGGSIIMVPLLLFVPQALGIGVYDMKVVAAMSTVQVFFSALSGVFVHRRQGNVSRSVVLVMGVSAAVSGFIGAYASKFLSAQVLLLVFAGISTIAIFLMFIPAKRDEWLGSPDEVPFRRPVAIAVSIAIGILGGAIGAPGAFIFVPLMIYVLKIPTRITLGSTLAIVLLTSLAGVLGKFATGQVPWGLSLALVLGSIPGAQLGARFSTSPDPQPALRHHRLNYWCHGETMDVRSSHRLI